jgi:hypothetical protein
MNKPFPRIHTPLTIAQSPTDITKLHRLNASLGELLTSRSGSPPIFFLDEIATPDEPDVMRVFLSISRQTAVSTQHSARVLFSPARRAFWAWMGMDAVKWLNADC